MRDALPLTGVVAVDSALDRASLVATLRAYDLDAPLLDLRPQDRDRIRALVRDRSMSIIVYGADRRPLRVLPPPESLSERNAFEKELVSLAAQLRAR